MESTMATWAPMIVTRCCDCGLGTNVAREWYMVKPNVWTEAWAGRRKPWHALPGQSVLCIGCLEQRIGRTLCAADFADAVVNDPEGDISERLRRRLTATRSWTLEPPEGSKSREAGRYITPIGDRAGLGVYARSRLPDAQIWGVKMLTPHRSYRPMDGTVAAFR
jgi:hypothetical protein